MYRMGDEKDGVERTYRVMCLGAMGHDRGRIKTQRFVDEGKEAAAETRAAGMQPPF